MGLTRLYLAWQSVSYHMTSAVVLPQFPLCVSLSAALPYAGEKGIVCDVEEITMDYVNTALERLMKNDVHYRLVQNVLLCKVHAAGYLHSDFADDRRSCSVQVQHQCSEVAHPRVGAHQLQDWPVPRLVKAALCKQLGARNACRQSHVPLLSILGSS